MRICADYSGDVTSGGWPAFSVGIRSKFPARFFALLGALLVLSLPAPGGETESDVTLLANRPETISIRYATPPPAWEVLQAEWESYRTPRLRSAGTSWQEGAPQLPVRVVWLVIPPGTTPILGSVIPYGIHASQNRPAPVPASIAGTLGFADPVYEEDPAFYASLTPTPSVWVEIEGPERFRNLEVIRLLIYPFRFPTSDGGMLGLDSLDVSVILQGGKASRSSFSRPVEDDLYRRLFANWSGPATSWKLPRSSQIAGTSDWPSGEMYKITVGESGIYKLTYSDLVSAGVDPIDIIPAKLRIFNNGGRTLPQGVATVRPDSLIENAILVQDGNDGSFDPGDEIWFYGKSVHEWEWSLISGRYIHYQNPYTDHNIYWLNINPDGPAGKRMASLGQSGTAWLNPPGSRAYLFEEKELYAIYNDYDLPLYMPNLFGDVFSGPSASRTFGFYLEAVESTAPAHLLLDFQPASGYTHQFEVLINSVPIIITSNTTISVTIPAGVLQSGNNSLYLKHNSSGSSYLDYFEIEYTRELTTTSGELPFVSPDADGLAQYQISGLSDPWIFNVTNFDDVTYVHTSSFKDSSLAVSPKRYLAVDTDALRSSESITGDQLGTDDYTTLRDPALGADILVITADEFYDAMEDYESYREADTSGVIYEVLRVRVSDIIDEFGWGLTDPVAIRDFVSYTQDPVSGWSTPPLYILYVGDGDFDYKNKLAAGDDNWVIPFESGLTCTDDFYTCFTPGGTPSSFPCLATGRWPVRSVAEVSVMIERLIAYEAGSFFGPWRDRVTFVADDEYRQGSYYSSEKNHVEDTEYIAETYIPDIINMEKIYLTEYPGVPDPSGGIRKPGATDDLIDAINEGCLLVNYIGHGNPTVWAHENVFQQSRDLPLLNNSDKLPLFLAFTCDWAYWDDPFEQSMPEEMLHMSGGGAIAAIAATRVTSSGPNAVLAYNFFNELFSEPTGVKLGDALMLAKTSYTTNSEKYHLLGDPVMKIAMPQLVVYIDSTSTDTLTALDQVSVSGEVRTQAGTTLPTFDGIANVQVFDSEIPVVYAFNGDPNETITYILSGNLIFRGDVSIQAGQFESSFIVPIDISYGGDGGRFSVYGYSGETDAAGVHSNVVFAESIVALEDTISPTVSLYFDSPGFRSGDPVGSEATLYVDVADSNGVNLTGSAGHGIIVTIDGAMPIELTDSFSYDLDSYTTGTAEYTLSTGEIASGVHTAEVIAWDAANNPGTAQISFEVAGWDELRLTEVLNFPNPFHDYTRFTFVLGGTEAEGSNVTIKVYTVAGRLVKVIDGIVGNDTFNYNDQRLVWDGRDHSGTKLSNGVYIYKVLVEGFPSRRLVEETGKLIVMR